MNVGGERGLLMGVITVGIDGLLGDGDSAVDILVFNGESTGVCKSANGCCC